jgi:hypothetical protein
VFDFKKIFWSWSLLPRFFREVASNFGLFSMYKLFICSLVLKSTTDHVRISSEAFSFLTVSIINRNSFHQEAELLHYI